MHDAIEQLRVEQASFVKSGVSFRSSSAEEEYENDPFVLLDQVFKSYFTHRTNCSLHVLQGRVAHSVECVLEKKNVALLSQILQKVSPDVILENCSKV